MGRIFITLEKEDVRDRGNYHLDVWHDIIMLPLIDSGLITSEQAEQITCIEIESNPLSKAIVEGSTASIVIR